MLKFNRDKGNCTGCAACYSACPVHCITMNADDEGFLYPDASEACIDCGLCEKVCPAVSHKGADASKRQEEGAGVSTRQEQTADAPMHQKAFAAVAKDAGIWRRSASGGAFSEICRHWADADTLIVGAAWDGLRVHHVGVKGFGGIAPLCKSKYVSSAIEDTFVEIREALKAGRRAVFCGCPCQVAGLKAFLRKDYENLLTIDLICHGAGSPSVFEACMKRISDFFGEEVKTYQFRAKRKYFQVDYLSRVETKRGTHYVVKDPYIQLFLSQNALRPSCGKNCKYRDPHRPGDITIADFKGLTDIFPDLTFQKKNWSTIVCNTQKGERAVSRLETTMEMRPCKLSDVIKHNPLFARQTFFSQERDAFFQDFKADKDRAIAKWTVPPTVFKPSLKKTVLNHLPTTLLQFASKMLHLMR